MRKIKWENVIFTIMLILDFICIIHHIRLNGLYFNLIIEVIIYTISSLLIRYVIKDIRKNPDNWRFN